MAKALRCELLSASLHDCFQYLVGRGPAKDALDPVNHASPPAVSTSPALHSQDDPLPGFSDPSYFRSLAVS